MRREGRRDEEEKRRLRRREGRGEEKGKAGSDPLREQIRENTFKVSIVNDNFRGSNAFDQWSSTPKFNQTH